VEFTGSHAACAALVGNRSPLCEPVFLWGQARPEEVLVAFPTIRNSTPIRVAFIVLCVLLAEFLLLFGVAHLVHPDVPSPDAPSTYSALGIVISLTLCGMGVVLLLVAATEIRRIFFKRESSSRENEA